MVQVPTYEEFTDLQKQVAELRREIQFMKQSELDWMTIDQVAQAINKSKMTVYRLTKNRKLTPRYEGCKPLYELAQIRDYIRSTRVSAEAADSRVLSAIHHKDRKS